MRTAAIRGGLWAIAMAFPLAAGCALLYRFPVPFAGYLTGPSAMPGALAAVLFYGVLGGFVALFAGGAAGGVLAHAIGRPSGQRVHWLTIGFALVSALLGVVLLATLDKFIGPW